VLQNEKIFRNLQRGTQSPLTFASRSNAVSRPVDKSRTSPRRSIVERLSGSWSPSNGRSYIMSDEEFEALPDYSDQLSRTIPSLDSIVDQNPSLLPSILVSPVERQDTRQMQRLRSIERFPSRVQFDYFVSMRSCEESMSSHHTMFNYREQQRRLFAEDAKVNNERIRRDGIHFFLSIAGSEFKRAEYLRVEELGLHAQIPKMELDAWLSNAYHESTRPLSVDAADWTHWNPAVGPWTTWKAS
jgi:hypothetical protein